MARRRTFDPGANAALAFHEPRHAERRAASGVEMRSSQRRSAGVRPPSAKSTGGVMAFSNLATGRLADWLGAGPMLALPGLAFGAVTVLTLCAPTLREIYGRRLASTAMPSAIGRLRPRV